MAVPTGNEKQQPDLGNLIEIMGFQLLEIRNLTKEDRPLNERLKLFEAFSKTCLRIARLMEHQQKLSGNTPVEISAVLGQVLKEYRSEEGQMHSGK